MPSPSLCCLLLTPALNPFLPLLPDPTPLHPWSHISCYRSPLFPLPPASCCPLPFSLPPLTPSRMHPCVSSSLIPPPPSTPSDPLCPSGLWLRTPLPCAPSPPVNYFLFLLLCPPLSPPVPAPVPVPLLSLSLPQGAPGDAGMSIIGPRGPPVSGFCSSSGWGWLGHLMTRVWVEGR